MIGFDHNPGPSVRINRRYDYQPIERITRPDGVRHYLCPNTKTLLPSVTTVLSATADKTALKEWQERVGEEKAELARTEATGLGSLLHLHIENYVLGIERPRGNNLVRVMARTMADKIIEQGLPAVDEVWGQEVALHYPGLYAGTTDLVGLYRGRPAIMDHKTAKKMRKRSMILDYFDQMGAYAISHDHLFGTKIEIGIIFMVARDGTFQRFTIEGNELEHHKTNFLLRLERFLHTPVF